MNQSSDRLFGQSSVRVEFHTQITLFHRTLEQYYLHDIFISKIYSPLCFKLFPENEHHDSVPDPRKNQ